MKKILFFIRGHQVKFFSIYYLIVLSLIAWSYWEGVGDISGTLTYKIGAKSFSSVFKAGYFSSLNYGIYYIIFLPLFLRSVLTTYFSAEKLSNLNEESESDVKVKDAVRRYSSYIILFLESKYSAIIFFGLLAIFSYQNLLVEKNDYQNLSLGWVQGLTLKDSSNAGKGILPIKKNFYFRNSIDSNYTTIKLDSIKVSHLSFASHRKPNKIEFIIFVCFAKFFFALFVTIAFFFNINILYGLLNFFRESDKKYLFESAYFIQTMDKLIQHISLSGFFLTIFMFFRYIANAQKGTFKPFNWSNPFASDQYIFMLGTIFIPITAIVLFTYIYISNKSVELKKLSWKNIVAFYLPNLFFALTFFIYLINFDPAMDSQLQFMKGIIHFVDKQFLG